MSNEWPNSNAIEDEIISIIQSDTALGLAPQSIVSGTRDAANALNVLQQGGIVVVYAGDQPVQQLANGHWITLSISYEIQVGVADNTNIHELCNRVAQMLTGAPLADNTVRLAYAGRAFSQEVNTIMWYSLSFRGTVKRGMV